MDHSPNLEAFQVVRQLHGSLVFQAGGQRRRAVRLVKTTVAPPVSRRLGHYTLGTVLTI